MLTCRQIHRFLEHVLTGQQKRNHSDKETFLVSVILVFFQLHVFNYVRRLVERDKQDYHGKRTLIVLDSYLWSWCSPAGMVLHLDLLNYGEAVDRLSNCLPLSLFPYIHLNSTRYCSCQCVLHSLAATSSGR